MNVFKRTLNQDANLKNYYNELNLSCIFMSGACGQGTILALAQ